MKLAPVLKLCLSVICRREGDLIELKIAQLAVKKMRQDEGLDYKSVD